MIIRERPHITIGDYSVNGEISYQALQDDKIELLIDKAKFFAFKVDDVDKAQSDIRIMNEATTDAAQAMKVGIDTLVLGSIYSNAGLSIVSTALTSINVLDWLVDANVLLDENNVPRDGKRWFVFPPWVAGRIKKSDLKNASLTGDEKSVLRTNGYLGEIDGSKLFVSNCLSNNGTTWQSMGGHPCSTTFASQITKVETLRLQSTFGDAIRGLNVFGFKVNFANGLVSMPCTKG